MAHFTLCLRRGPGVILLATLIVAWAGTAAAASTAPIVVDYPAEGSLFPPDYPSPEFLWRDQSSSARSWTVQISFADGSASIRQTASGTPPAPGKVDPRCVAPTNQLPHLTGDQKAWRAWTPDPAAWRAIRAHAVAASVTVTFTGYAAGSPSVAVSRGQVTLRVSSDPVGAPILYRDVPLMPSETEKGVIKPLAAAAVPLIAWRLRDTAESSSRLLMEGLPTCANCHSASRDGSTLGIDVDGPQNDKGLYALVSIRPETVIRQQDVIAWSTFEGKLGGKLRVGFMSQVSPDGRYVATTINDPGAEQSEYRRRKNPLDLINNYFVANFPDYRFLQVFYPTRGVIAWYSRETGHLQPLPGADDPEFVQTNAVWSPDGKYLVFSRARARDAYPAGAVPALHANDSNETPIQYDLYRIPFNEGRGGRAEPIAGAGSNGKSNSFPKISPDGKWIVYVQARNGQLMRPDGRLFIVPAAGGEAREMRCNTPLMNSWHSFSPNGRWMVFSSKSRSPYTQMYLTHIDEQGNDTPPILIANATAANRAVNLPEFVNVPPGGLRSISAPATDYYREVDTASALAKKGQWEEAAAGWRKALELNPAAPLAHNNYGLALVETGHVNEAIAEYQSALELSPEYPEALNNLGSALVRKGRVDDAIADYQRALELDPAHVSAHTNLGAALAQSGRVAEAMPHFERALELQPEDGEANNDMGLALAMTGRLEDAIVHLEKAVAASPRAFDFQFNLGRILAAKARFTDAAPHFEEAVRLSGARDATMLDLLAGVYAEAGRYADAVKTAQHALDLATQQGRTAMLEQLRARLESYKRHAAGGR